MTFKDLVGLRQRGKKGDRKKRRRTLAVACRTCPTTASIYSSTFAPRMRIETTPRRRWPHGGANSGLKPAGSPRARTGFISREVNADAAVPLHPSFYLSLSNAVFFSQPLAPPARPDRMAGPERRKLSEHACCKAPPLADPAETPLSVAAHTPAEPACPSGSSLAHGGVGARLTQALSSMRPPARAASEPPNGGGNCR